MWQIRLVALLYCLSGMWCAYQPELASSYLGLAFLNSVALVEFLSVYGGLQIGIGLGFFSASFSQELVKGALWLMISISFSLLLFRLVAMLRYATFQHELVFMLVVEAMILILLIFCYLKLQPGKVTAN